MRYLLVILIAIATSLVSDARYIPAPVSTASVPVSCAEDEPCWQWWAMGNRTRGVDGMCETATGVGIVRYPMTALGAASYCDTSMVGPLAELGTDSPANAGIESTKHGS